MAQKLSDRDMERIRELAGEGRSPAELAEQFGVSRRHVGRLLRGEQRQRLGRVGGLDRGLAEGSVVRAVECLLAGLGRLDDERQVQAQAALALAGKLDQVCESNTAASATAAPAIARQLVEVVARLRGEVHEPDAIDDLRARREARQLAVAAAHANGAGRGAG